MKNAWRVVAFLLLPAAVLADARQTEIKGIITELDDVITLVRVKAADKEMSFTISEDALVRDGLTRLSYADLRPGDEVTIRYWEDSDKADRVDLRGRGRDTGSVQGPVVLQNVR